MMTTHRALQVHVLLDDVRAQASQLARAAANARQIGVVRYWREALVRARRLRRVERLLVARLFRDQWALRRCSCSGLVAPPLERRPGNALNMEIGQALPRCLDKPPRSWGTKAPMGLRWLGSGGSPLVFGLCSARCPRVERP